MKNLKRAIALLLTFVMCLGVLAGCGGSNEPAATTTTTTDSSASTETKTENKAPAKEVVVTLGTNTAWTDIRPYVDGVMTNRMLTGFWYDRLFHGYTNGEFEPRGADSWEVSADGKVVTFHLNKNAKWTDGQPVTAYDYEFACLVMTTEGNPATPTFGSHYADLVGVDSKTFYATGAEPVGVKALDDYTIQYTFKEVFVPEITMIDDAWNWIALPKHCLEGQDPTKYLDWEFWKNPVSNGPMMVESEIAGSEIVMVPNKDYYLGAPQMDKLKVILMDASSMAPALIAGDIDMAYPAPSDDDMQMLVGMDGVHVFQMEYPTMLRSIFINNTTVTDERVRRALDIAVDREAVCAALGNADLVSTPITMKDRYYNEAAAPVYDPEAAKALLAEAAADGAIDLSKPLELVVVAGVGQTVANIVQQNWQDLGLTVVQQPMENSAMLAGFKADTVNYGTINRMYSANPVAMCYANGSGYLRMNKDIWSDLKKEFLTATTQEARDEIVDRFQVMWQEEVPAIIIGAAYETYAYSDLIGDGESIGQECVQLGSVPIWRWNVKR